VRDRRYSTVAWQRVRLLVLARDGRVCQVGGPRCTIRATQVDHIVPTSQGGAFFNPANLRASCRRCNLHGPNVQHENRNLRQVIEQLERIAAEQAAELEQLRAQLAGENGEATEIERRPLTPRIY
jgi:5-methylcytosine-specific restriction endonuclease McrA